MVDSKPNLELKNMTQSHPHPPVVPADTAQPIELNTRQMAIRKPRRWLTWGVIALAVVVAGLAATAVWYKQQLRPVNTLDEDTIQVEIASGMLPADIAERLEAKQVIRSSQAFLIYTRLHGVRNQLQAGSYYLSASLSTPEVVDRLIGGETGADKLVVTFVPGATLKDNSDKPIEKKQDIYHTLHKLGYDEQQIQAALNATYDVDGLFIDKPDDTSLEGYIYGDTYHFEAGTPAEDIIQRALEEMQAVVESNDLVAAYDKQGLTLYQGLTLASIIQREVPDADDQKQVAQVFLKRFREGKELGSDVTAYYGADLEGKRSAVSTDTPYNTRIHPGLPPGPISSPGLSALLAVAQPASGDYTYFLSGDDDITYFARTNQEHERNIELHCKQKCDME